MTFPDHLVRPDHRGVERLALTLGELAKALGVSERHIQQQIKNGEIDIPSLRLGRCRLFPVDSVKAWLAEQVK